MTNHIELDQNAGASFAPARALGFRHRLATTGLFDDEPLAALLDGYPGEHLEATTMGRCFAEGGWRHGTAAGVGGTDILRAVRHGHLWLNLKYLHVHSTAFAALMDEVYEELAHRIGEHAPRWRRATLLISSPTAFVHYHADSVPNILWHARGRKRVIVYPDGDARFAPPAALEKICSGESEEGLPYEPAFDAEATSLELDPGAGAMWPQNAPHRVDNLSGLNVSLSTEHVTPDTRRRVHVLRANHVLRRWRLAPASDRTRGLASSAKVLLAVAHRGLAKARRRPAVTFARPCTFTVDPDAPSGYVDVDS